MNRPTPPGTSSSPVSPDGNILAHSSGKAGAKSRPPRFTAKRTPRRRPGSSPRTGLQNVLLGSPVEQAATVSTTAHIAAATASLTLPPLRLETSLMDAYHDGIGPALPPLLGVPPIPSQDGLPNITAAFRSSAQGAARPDSQPLGTTLDEMSLDDVYTFRSSSPVTAQPKEVKRQSNGATLARATLPETLGTPKTQSLPASPSRNGDDRGRGLAYIDLTRDTSTSGSEQPTSANGEALAKLRNAEPEPSIPSPLPSPSLSDASVELPSASDMLRASVRVPPHTPTKKRKQHNRTPRTAGTRQLPNISPAKPSEPRVFEHPSSSRPQVFSEDRIDRIIYQHKGASRPPNEGRPSGDQRLYIHADPAIHGMHDRSDAWHAQKALEIQQRGGRKFWFGKAVARQLWLDKKEAESASSKEQALNGDTPPERREPQPRAYKRPVDFGDVPEAKLPEEVQQNPDWLKACAWFRRQHNLRDVRRRASKKYAQEANEYFNILTRQVFPDLGGEAHH